MSRKDQIGMLANLSRIKATDQIRRAQYDPADYEKVYKLFRLATGSEQKAAGARLESLRILVDQATKSCF